MRKPSNELERFWVCLPDEGEMVLATGEIALTCFCGEVTIFDPTEEIRCPDCKKTLEEYWNENEEEEE